MNVVIVHGCPSSKKEEKDQTYFKHWIPWTRRKLEEKGIKVETPLMPEPWHPDYKRFKEVFDKCDVNENTILVGHSCGSAFLVRWLGDTGKKARKLVMVAPWKKERKEGDSWRQKFYGYDIDPSVKNRVGEIVMFTSDNEDPKGKESLKIFHNALGGKVIDLPNHGHYCEDDMGTDKFPELVEEICRSAKKK